MHVAHGFLYLARCDVTRAQRHRSPAYTFTPYFSLFSKEPQNECHYYHAADTERQLESLYFSFVHPIPRLQ